MARTEIKETAPKPGRRVADPLTVLTGTIIRSTVPTFVKVIHEKVIVNHRDLDASIKEVNPMLGRARRCGMELYKKDDFECSGSDSSFPTRGGNAYCGKCLLEVSDKSTKREGIDKLKI